MPASAPTELVFCPPVSHHLPPPGPYARKDALRGMVLFLMAAAYVQYATPFEIQGPSSLIAMPLPIYAIWGSMAWRSLATMPEHRGGKDK
mmetsp:Transcript_19896/g.45992  ORF Transcript_19896/g.45992 Transcript_19896/m.45992 type:complete len:90 (+) Transcript_19896:223-492(+)